MTFDLTWPSIMTWFRLIGGYCEPSTGKYYDFPWKPEIVIFMEFLWKSWNCKHYYSSWNWDFDYHIFYYGRDPLYSLGTAPLTFLSSLAGTFIEPPLFFFIFLYLVRQVLLFEPPFLSVHYFLGRHYYMNLLLYLFLFFRQALLYEPPFIYFLSFLGRHYNINLLLYLFYLF